MPGRTTGGVRRFNRRLTTMTTSATTTKIRYRVLYRESGRDISVAAPAVVSRARYRDIGLVEADDLEGLFREMNAVDGTETCRKLRVRSMSVGDVAIDTRVGQGVAYYCASYGWRRVGFVP